MEKGIETLLLGGLCGIILHINFLIFVLAVEYDRVLFIPLY